MAVKSYAEPKPGQPIPRGGKPYIWVTWLAKLLGGDQCVRSVWFKAHYKYAKAPEQNAEQLAEWNREHNAMMRDRRAFFEENGYTVTTERDFKLEGKTAILAGKEDLVAEMPGHVLIEDGKTGKRRDSDFYQVLLYLYARVHQPRRDEEQVKKLSGQVFYRAGQPVPVRLIDIAKHEADILAMVERVAGDAEPAANPSKRECERCNIRREDCPQKYDPRRVEDVLHTGAF